MRMLQRLCTAPLAVSARAPAKVAKADSDASVRFLCTSSPSHCPQREISSSACDCSWTAPIDDLHTHEAPRRRHPFSASAGLNKSATWL